MSALSRAPLPAWLSYGSLALLQAKVIWGIWSFRDLSGGDTGSYYALAGLWSGGLRVNLLWSPLYTAFFGTFRSFWADAFVATTLHRVAILFLAAFLVLAVARRILPEPFAWGVAAWWAVLPVHFNTLYEVHLFAVLPLLAAWLAALAWPGRAGRGACLGLLLLAALLVRNEYALSAAAFAAGCAWLEVREARVAAGRGADARGPGLARAYALPAACALLVTLVFASRSVVRTGPDLASTLAAKHRISACQPYAFGWLQRHPEWRGDPWTGCAALLEAHFGEPEPGFARMVRLAPGRVAEHVLWNLRLAPGGLQLLLFNAMDAPASPDYSLHNPRRPALAWGATALLVLVLAGGARAARRAGTPLFEPRLAAGWLAIASVAATALYVIPTQRPRPAYLFAAGIGLALLAGRCLQLLAERTLRGRARWLAAATVAVMVAAPLAAPRYFETRGHHDVEQPRRHAVRRLAPYRDLLARDGNVALVSGCGWEIEGYTDAGFSPAHRAERLEDVCPPGPGDLRSCVERRGATLLYLGESARAQYGRDEDGRRYLDAPESFGWRRLAPAAGSGEGWLLLARLEAAVTGP